MCKASSHTPPLPPSTSPPGEQGGQVRRSQREPRMSSISWLESMVSRSTPPDVLPVQVHAHTDFTVEEDRKSGEVPTYAVDLSTINLEALPGADATSEIKQPPPPTYSSPTTIKMGFPMAGSQHAYRYDIDGLRTVAVLAVVLFHTDGRWLPGGFVGVDIFFVISGYVVAGSLLRKPAPSLGPYLAAFYSRRVKRLTPALALVVLASSLALACLVPPTEHSVSEFMVSGIISLFGGANMYFAVVAPSSQGVTADGHAVDDRPPSPPTTPPSPPSPATPRPPTSPPPPRCVDLT